MGVVIGMGDVPGGCIAYILTAFRWAAWVVVESGTDVFSTKTFPVFRHEKYFWKKVLRSWTGDFSANISVVFHCFVGSDGNAAAVGWVESDHTELAGVG